ncbi:Nse4 C-terminal-domain-containing protein [Mycena amicta]|nr:Nse4 C-terminal-domain-containing protein [Mycena amicta]
MMSQSEASQTTLVNSQRSDESQEQELVDLPYDPYQPAEIRRNIRREYRALLRRIDDKPTDAELEDAVYKADSIWEDVKNTGELVLESPIFLKTAGLHAHRARSIKVGTGPFSVMEFVTRLQTFMARQPLEEDSEDVEDEQPLDWDRIGRLALAKSRRVPVMRTMFGPLSIEPKQRAKRKPRAKPDKAIAETQTQELCEADIARSQNETTTNVNKLRTILGDLTGPESTINLFELVVNPHSFAQTVENMFHLSFLVRDGDAAIVMEEDLPRVFRSEKPTENQTLDEGLTKRQLVLEMDMKAWRRAIEVFKLTQSVIPTRERETT